MVDEFSSFARMPKPRVESNDLGECIRRVLFLMRVAHPNIVFEDHLPEQPVLGHFDRRLLSQALTNIVKNATEGIEAYAGDASFAGRISVTLSVAGETGVHRRRRQWQRLPEGQQAKAARALYDDARGGDRARTCRSSPKSSPIMAAALELRDAPRGRGAWVRLFFPLNAKLATPRRRGRLRAERQTADASEQAAAPAAMHRS